MSFELFLGPAVAFVLGAKFTLHKIEEVNKTNKEYIEKIQTTFTREYVDHNQQLEKVRQSTELTDTRLTTTNARLNAIEDKLEETAATIDVIDKQTLQKMVTTLQPVSAALKEVQTFVGLRS